MFPSEISSWTGCNNSNNNKQLKINKVVHKFVHKESLIHLHINFKGVFNLILKSKKLSKS